MKEIKERSVEELREMVDTLSAERERHLARIQELEQAVLSVQITGASNVPREAIERYMPPELLKR